MNIYNIRFISKVDKKETHECWNWKGSLNSGGYGQFYNGHTVVLAHRFAYESFHSRKIPHDLYVLHRCDNPVCCNPIHLFLGTQKDNMKDMVEKGRSSKSSIYRKNMSLSMAKLHEGELWLIKKLWNSGKLSQSIIAKMFKVTQHTISVIVNSKKHPCKEGYYV